MIYLDNAATTKPDLEVLETYHKLLKTYFINKEGIYDKAVKLEKLYEQSKHQLLKLLKITDYQCMYTSGASEANNFIIKNFVFKNFNKRIRIITTKIEHASIISTLEFLEKSNLCDVVYLDVLNDGSLDLAQLEKNFTSNTELCVFSSVNSEMGFHFNLDEVVSLIRSKSSICHIHLDAVQGFAKVNTEYNKFDSIAISAHKINGLKGSGALFYKTLKNACPLIHGGQQENGLRGGTVDVCHHLVFAKTARLALINFQNTYQHISDLNKYLRNQLSCIDGIVINTPVVASDFILNVSLLGYAPEVIVHALEEYNILVATKSACSSKKQVSAVLQALDLPNNIKESAIRISFTYGTTFDEVDHLIYALKSVLSSVKKRSKK